MSENISEKQALILGALLHDVDGYGRVVSWLNSEQADELYPILLKQRRKTFD